MVNTELLAKHVAQFKPTKEAAIEYYKNLFKKRSDIAEAYGADGIDPDSIGHSSRFVLMAQDELQYFFQLPKVVDNERQWRSALSDFKEQFSIYNASLSLFNKLKESFFAILTRFAGGLSAEQKKNWEELLDKAYADMKKWGWY